MSTRSNICRVCKDGLLEKVYCHFDGYFSGVGADLVEFCSTQEKVDLFFDKAALYDIDGNCIRSVKETLETTRKPAEGLGEVNLHLNEWDISRYLSEVKENISIEFLYIWVPIKFVKERWIEEHIAGFRDLDKKPNNIEENGGAWIACSNSTRIWSWVETLVKDHLGKKPEKVEKKDSRDIEDYKNMVEGLHEIADKIKSADYLPKTLEAYDAYISALSYMVNKLKEDKVNLIG